MIRSIPLLLAKFLATIACFYFFPPIDLKGVVFGLLALWATTESLVGARFTFQANSVRVLEHLGRWPYRIPYSEVGQVAQERVGRMVYLKVERRTDDVTIGGWRSYVFPNVEKRVDEIRKEFEWRAPNAEG